MILIERKIFTSKSTTGILSIDGNVICYTLEDVARPDNVKVLKETCIPAGDYKFLINYSQRFKRALPLIYSSDDLSIGSGNASWKGIRIHPGNSNEDTEGCVLVGMAPGHDWVTGSREAMDKLFPLLMDLFSEGKTDLTIINKQS